MIEAPTLAQPTVETAARPEVRPRARSLPSWLNSQWSVRLLLTVIILTSSTATITAMRRTLPTFDEITTMAGGARGFATGRFDMMPDFPPLMQYLYGLPVFLTRPNYPEEVRQDTVPHRYAYAQDFLYRVGNDPERVALTARLVAAACAALLVLLVYAFASRSFGTGTGLLAAALVAFLPDVLAHGGIAYNDIALAPAFVGAVWVIDRALRSPSIARGALAGAAVSLAVAIKHSSLALGPIAVVLLVMELLGRWQRTELRRWLPATGFALLAAVVAGYLLQVALYQGDFALSYLRASTVAAKEHISGGHGVGAYLLGRLTSEAPWYFYPVAFLFKTSVALHALVVLAVIGAVITARSWDWRSLLTAPARAPVVATVIFGGILLQANLVIGFRYALPLLPLICILTAAGVVVLWRRTTPVIRAAIVLLTMWSAASALVYHPHFLAYTSEYQSDPELGYTVFVDSSFDWGQGLLELRDFMRDEGVGQVYLSYFGSALPEGYGIDYVSLPSFFPLPPRPTPQNEPKYAAVSATNLVGMYFTRDVFGELRRRPPYKVLGHTLFVYEVSP